MCWPMCGPATWSTRRFFFAANTSRAPASYEGATTTSVKTSAMASAISAVTSRLAATTPPNADTGSVAKARR